MERRKEDSHQEAPPSDRSPLGRWAAPRSKQHIGCILGDRAMKTLAFVALGLNLAHANAADASAQCPLTVADTSMTMHAPAGWVGSTSQAVLHLSEFGMMAGAPETMTYLVPNSRNRGKAGASSTWVFAAGDEKWLYCRYGATGLVQLSKRLDDAATSCTITSTSDKRGAVTCATVACEIVP